MGSVRINLDDRVENIVDCECNTAIAGEKRPYSFTTFIFSTYPTVPYPIFNEQTSYAVGVLTVVTKSTIFGLKIPDGFYIF